MGGVGGGWLERWRTWTEPQNFLKAVLLLSPSLVLRRLDLGQYFFCFVFVFFLSTCTSLFLARLHAQLLPVWRLLHLRLRAGVGAPVKGRHGAALGVGVQAAVR